MRVLIGREIHSFERDSFIRSLIDPLFDFEPLLVLNTFNKEYLVTPVDVGTFAEPRKPCVIIRFMHSYILYV